MKRRLISVFGLIVLSLSACGGSILSTKNNEATPNLIPSIPPVQFVAGPTATRETQVGAKFDISSAKTVAPQDILEEISYYGQGAGAYCSDTSYPSPKVGRATETTELMYVGVLIVCGWKTDETLTGIIQFPDGKIITIPVGLENDGEAYYGRLAFTPTLNDLPGDYLFKIKGKSATVQVTITFNAPDGPHIYLIEDDELLLHGFAPNEKIRLFCYVSAKLAGWEEYTVDASGKLTLRFAGVPISQAGDFGIISDFVALGEKSGEAHILRPHVYYGGSIDMIEQGTIVKQPVCGNLKSYLHKGGAARITITDGTKTRIRAKAGFTQKILDSLPEGTPLTILQGPVCADKSAWWQVRTKDGLEGWMAEYQGDTYLLEPLP